MDNRGKQFEEHFKKDWVKSFPQTFILRLPDQISGYKYTSSNLCDFIAYNNHTLYLLECKTHKGSSLPFDAIPQYDKLKSYYGIDGIRVGIILWLYEKDIVMYVPISTINQMKIDGKKSVGLKSLNEGYNIKIIPSIKKRIFMDSNYKCFLELSEGE